MSSTVLIAPPSWLHLISTDDKPKPIKHLFIEQQSQSVKGQHAISPYAEDVYPPRFDPPRDATKRDSSSSAMFETHSSAVNVTVWVESRRPAEIVREPKSTGRCVLIDAKTTYGNLKIEVPIYTCPQPLSIRAKSHTGHVLVHIPPTFSGMLSWQCETGGFKPSPDILARYTPIGEQKKHRGVGRIRAADWTHDSSERGDSAELITARGSLFLFEAGEASNANRCVIQ